MNKNYLKWVFILAILVVGTFFIFGDLIKNPEELVVVDEQSTEATKEAENKDNIKNNTLESVIKVDGSIKTNKSFKPPMLGHALHVTTHISGLERDEILEQIKHFEASLKNKPENLHEWIQLGNLRKAIGDYLSAVEYWKYASLLEPRYHVPYNNLGNLYQYYLNDMVKAEENYKRYIELSPQTEEPYKLLFELYSTSYKEKENLAQGVLEEGIKNATQNEYLKRLLEIYKKEKVI